MKRIALMVKYVAEAFSAIAEGLDVVTSKWPSGNPFKSVIHETKQTTESK